MSTAAFELVTLKSGQRSIRSVRHGEVMHVGSGPRSEALALHVGQQRLVERAAAAAGPFVIWDVGLGAAANALTALEALREAGLPAELHSFEIDPELLFFASSHAAELGYLAGWEGAVAELLERGETRPAPGLPWRLHLGPFEARLAHAPAPDAIFHDPYSPAQNPGMYAVELFRAMRERAAARPCLLTNYTRSTAVRVALALAGWFVGTGAATGEKEETTIAASRPGLLEHPLGPEWLGRVRRSTAASPYRRGAARPGPIAEEDFAALARLPQFARE